MKINRELWIAAFGQAGSGKTFWTKEHLKAFPKDMAFIFDFNAYDFKQFKDTQNLWVVEYGTDGEFEQFLKIPYERGNCFVVLEEADTYLYKPSEFTRRFVLTARNRGIGCIASFKRSKNIQPIFRHRFTHLVLFRCTIPEDLDYIEKWIGVTKGTMSFLRNLKVGEHVIVDLMNNSISEVKKL